MYGSSARGRHSMPPHRHRPNPVEAHQQQPVMQGRSWVFHRPASTGRHRMVCPNRLAGLAWPGETTQRLWLRSSGAGS